MKPVQLFDPASHRYTYLLFDEASREALLIDPVDAQAERDMTVLRQYDLTLRWVLYTDAPQASAAGPTDAGQPAPLLAQTQARLALAAGAVASAQGAAMPLEHGDRLMLGAEAIETLHTPGVSAHSMSYVWRGHVFTGATLLINGCGRAANPAAAEALYRSVTEQLFALPADTLVWPGHDQKGHSYSTIALEKAGNPAIAGMTLAEFVAHQQSLPTASANGGLPPPASTRPAASAPALPGAAGSPSAFMSQAGQAGALPPAGHAEPAQPAEGYAGDVSPQLAYQWLQSGAAVLVDVRTAAEREWVGFVPGSVALPWSHWPGMTPNPDFDAGLRAAVPPGKKAVLLCRSGVRSVAAAKRATELGIAAYNIVQGFEGDADAQGQRGKRGGWRHHGLPWRQN